MAITKKQLMEIAPAVSEENATQYTYLINQWAPYYSIHNNIRLAAFLAQILHETVCFRYTKEIASGAEYDTGKKAVELGNTPVKDGDGEKYKGRGCIMITGKTNYELVSKSLGVDFVSQPELLEQPRYAMQTACWWWWRHGLNILADEKDIKKITKVINGGYNGLADREALYKKALIVLV